MTRIEPPPPWLHEPATRRLLDALQAAGIEARFVGGCVRDALLGIEGGDIDLATPARPEAVIASLKRARIKALPTGIAHGTVTAAIKPRTFEITTLRRDVETDGRHAMVAFDTGWEEDAARRDFTINAIYLAPDGTVYDPAGGRADLAAKLVRFVGDPATRIAEDVLRILRYYRFEARFGSGDGDPAARTACRAAVRLLRNLSAERVSGELMRLLASPDPIRALSMMREDGILAAILPEATRIDRLQNLITPLGSQIEATTSPILRLSALISVNAGGATALGRRLRLSNVERKRLADLAPPWPRLDNERAQRLARYRFGADQFRDLMFLVFADGKLKLGDLNSAIALLLIWTPPTFPLGGDDVTALGIAPGPQVGRLLGAVRRWWEEGDFAAGREECLAQLKTLAVQP